MFDTGQMFWQRLTTGTRAPCSLFKYERVNLNLNGSAVGTGRFLKRSRCSGDNASFLTPNRMRL
ncbi:hypothetical protein VO64_1818 [Pseudomonas synxantha]|uniref:Uncharacterized protein n=1 Tax=Pseudomonas synxantha TaxID=47883 RepID=A0AAU8TKE2_9PSED|nr:hypothetical protein VO64_1818 [Pseudomonas synxantha]